MRFKAFTLSETLLMLAIVGILGMITLGSFVKLKPNKEALLFRKAYESTLKIVSDLINDEDLYPTITSYNITETLYFQSARILISASNYPAANLITYSVSSGAETDRSFSTSTTVSADTSTTNSTVTQKNRNEVFKDTTIYNGASYKKTNKFAYNFATKMSKKGNATISDSGATFTTPDGIYWKVDDYFDSSTYATISIYPVGNVTGAVAIPIKVEANGNVYATTTAGQDYLKTRK